MAALKPAIVKQDKVGVGGGIEMAVAVAVVVVVILEVVVNMIQVR